MSTQSSNGTAKLYSLPGGERNAQLIMARRQAILARPDVQAMIAELESALEARHRNQILTGTYRQRSNPR